MTEHTPGPWEPTFNPKRDNTEVCSIMDMGGDPDTGYVADVYRNYVGSKIPESEYQANARLIAAAPELLEALEAMLDERGALCREPENEAETIALAAIAKAKGGK